MTSFQRMVHERDLRANVGKLRVEGTSSYQAFRERRANGSFAFQTYCDAWLARFASTFAAMELNGNPMDAVRFLGNIRAAPNSLRYASST